MVDERAIALAALENFPVEVRRVTRAAHSFNTIYRVETARGTYALRVGPTLRIHTAGTAAAEAEWQRALVADGFAVPDVVLTSSGEPMVTVEGRTCVLFTWVHGRLMRPRLGPSRARLLGRLMARLHDHPVRRDFDVLHADKVLYWLVPDRLADVPAHGKVLTEARDNAQELIDQLWAGGEPQLIHGDLTAANVIEAPGAGPVPIDFQDLVIGFPEQDISFTLASFGRRDDREAMHQAFRAGYSEIRPWPDVSDTVMQGLIIARGLHQLNITLALADGPLPQDYLDYHGAKAKTWLQG
ncbi:phosphotransferase enzyme family protein [Kribbella antibiotica]|uniref:phosphotransferase enzyme family protein n=1 Tax=Kribbella antibiotica TaxID=190195 RepID=UPI0014044BFE|nr:phosphotransferase [Kribbella antibiotica]